MLLRQLRRRSRSPEVEDEEAGGSRRGVVERDGCCRVDGVGVDGRTRDEERSGVVTRSGVDFRSGCTVDGRVRSGVDGVADGRRICSVRSDGAGAVRSRCSTRRGVSNSDGDRWLRSTASISRLSRRSPRTVVRGASERSKSASLGRYASITGRRSASRTIRSPRAVPLVRISVRSMRPPVRCSTKLRSIPRFTMRLRSIS